MSSAKALQKTVILVVEDEPLLMMDAVDMIESAGMIALEAGTADEALAMLIGHPEISIVLTDIDMPGSMDGLKLAQMVRDRWPPLEIVIVSGHRTVPPEMMPERGRFFGKPFRHADMVRTLRDFAAQA